MNRSKRCSGVRVKRVLMYDEGIEAGDASVYGTEFRYVRSDGRTSSGVASNEPASAREENPLVEYLAKGNQSLFSRLTAGKDHEQTKGPLGESLLPGPSIIYARVVSENIHTGKTGSGFKVNEYLTTKEYPFTYQYGDAPVLDDQGNVTLADMDASGAGVEKTNLESEKVIDWLVLPLGLINWSTKKAWMAQGFRFLQNSMNGMPKRAAGYGGTYTPNPASGTRDTDAGYLVTMQEYDYFEPGEKVPMWDWDANAGTWVENMRVPGKEMDIVVEKKIYEDVTNDLSIEFDFGPGAVFPPPIFVTLWPTFSHSEQVLATHATTKLIRYPAIVKSVTSFHDGITGTTEFMAFNGTTGAPILTRLDDRFDGLQLANNTTPHNGWVYDLTIPASWYYPELGPRTQNANYSNELKLRTATIRTYGRKPTSDWLTGTLPQNVLEMTVQTFQKGWQSSWNDLKIDAAYGTAGVSELEDVWRPFQTYSYKQPESELAPSRSQQDNGLGVTEVKAWESGYFDMQSMFDWSASSQSDEWVLLEEATRYSPNGLAIEQRDVLNRYAATLYSASVNNAAPSMIADQARLDALSFEDYEATGSITSMAHTGTRSELLTNGMTLTNNVFLTDQLTDKGGWLHCWLHFTNPTGIDGDVTVTVGGIPHQAERVASTGEWNLYRVLLPGSSLQAGGNPVAPTIDYSGTGTVYVDDARFQPFNCVASCYVYDTQTLRLLAQFDNDHFGLMYQYDGQGMLVRKLAETRQGIKTIEEHNNATPDKDRPTQ